MNESKLNFFYQDIDLQSGYNSSRIYPSFFRTNYMGASQRNSISSEYESNIQASRALKRKNDDSKSKETVLSEYYPDRFKLKENSLDFNPLRALRNEQQKEPKSYSNFLRNSETLRKIGRQEPLFVNFKDRREVKMNTRINDENYQRNKNAVSQPQIIINYNQRSSSVPILKTTKFAQKINSSETFHQQQQLTTQRGRERIDTDNNYWLIGNDIIKPQNKLLKLQDNCKFHDCQLKHRIYNQNQKATFFVQSTPHQLIGSQLSIEFINVDKRTAGHLDQIKNKLHMIKTPQLLLFDNKMLQKLKN